MYYWVYPKHPPMRSYQFRMVRSALLANTLVCLPTGLGKTLIAAVVMYNFYRWFPQGGWVRGGEAGGGTCCLAVAACR
jgi:Fanconi anemia group M protein